MTTTSTDGTGLNREIWSRACDRDSIRAAIADRLCLEVDHVTDQKHFARDLAVDWLDRLELVIFLEDWTGLEFDDDELEEISVVGDLIRLFESAKGDRLN